MSRYIDADALMDALNVFKDRKNGNEHFMYGIETAKELLGIQPTVDAVPVVRCGECGHYHSEDDPAYCDELCTIHIEPTDGCLRGIKRGGKVGYRAADGERKDGAV